MSNGQPAPGWYPDHNNPTVVRYWDGQQWTAHTAPARPAQPQPVPASPSWFARNKAASIALGVVGAVAVLGIIGAAVGSTEQPEASAERPAAASGTTTTAPAPADETSAAPKAGNEASRAAAPEPAAEESTEAAPPPSVQDRFIDIVEKGSDAADSGNEIAVVQARKTRGQSACALLGPALTAKDWHGTVESVETELGGDDGVLSIEITGDIAVQTWNNSISDIGAGTLINPNSKVYAQLAQLNEGDDVTFSGHFVRDGANCLEEQSLMDINGMLTPDFSFEFTSVKAD